MSLNSATSPAPAVQPMRRMISIHALRERRDAGHADLPPECLMPRVIFYPRPPRDGCHKNATKFLSTPSASNSSCCCSTFSIHALPKRGAKTNDHGPRLKINDEPFLSTPSARRATMEFKLARENQQWKPFLSTPSARRATSAEVQGQLCRKEFLSTPSARRATMFYFYHGTAKSMTNHFFYPRPPRGGDDGANPKQQNQQWFGAFSIHALREEGDPVAEAGATVQKGIFYPRPPRGGRQTLGRRAMSLPVSDFLSTPSARRATFTIQFLSTPCGIADFPG